MNRIKILFVLLILLRYTTELYSQEVSFYYDIIVDSLSLQSEGDQLLENLTRQIWNESLLNWENDSLYEHSYNGNNLIDTIIAHKWRYGTTWGNEYKAAYNYNTNNKLVFENYWSWGGGWGEYCRYYYSYNGNGNLAEMNYYGLAGAEWRHFGRTVYSWNAFNLVTLIAVEGPYIYYNYWGPIWKEEFSYDSSNLLIMKERIDHYLLSYWELDFRDLYFYDNNGNNSERIRQDWNSSDSMWVIDYRYLYEWDVNNLLLSVIYQDWNSDSLDWENVWRETYTYTPQNNIATMFKETWAPGIGWGNYALRTYFYDLNYNWTEKLTQIWDGSIWKNSYRHLATWIEPVSVWETPTYLDAYYLSNNYPNPFNPSTKIKFTIPSVTPSEVEGSLVTLKVYDILGNEVSILVNEQKPSGQYEIEFSGINLPSGIYFYTLNCGNYTATRKMVLLK